MRKVLVVGLLVCFISGVSFADTFGTGANQFTIDFVGISGDTNPSNGYGIVNNDYRMGTYEITNDQWNKFKNESGTVYGNPTAAYDHDPYWTGTNIPTDAASWYEAVQFVNWLNTDAGYDPAYKFTGNQGTSGYTLGVWQSCDTGYDASNPYRNSNAYYFLPTQDEWVKAAYWNGTNLQTYATVGDVVPTAGVDTNYDRVVGQPWNVGNGIEELNGTFDMMGNVWEWIESPSYSGYSPSSERGVRGGCYGLNVSYLVPSTNVGYNPYYEYGSIGFRVASVPEPATLILLGFGSLGLLRKRRA